MHSLVATHPSRQVGTCRSWISPLVSAGEFLVTELRRHEDTNSFDALFEGSKEAWLESIWALGIGLGIGLLYSCTSPWRSFSG